MLLAAISLTAEAQDMEPGFKLLNEGSFSDAGQFFKTVLKNDPDNKTAKICYGRALGLGGQPAPALLLFNQLAAQFPEDKEVLLNQAEASLWNNKGMDALEIYQRLTLAHPNSFTAHLGLANSFASIKKYSEAFNAINMALQLDETNQQAQLSRKYIILGYANELASMQQNFDRALELIGVNLSIDGKDQESLNLKANVEIIAGRYESALATYDQLGDSTDRFMGKSLVFHLQNRNVEALQLAGDARRTANNTKTQMHYFNALLWNNQLKEAEHFLDTVAKFAATDKELLAAKARYYLYKGDFLASIKGYNQLLALDSMSFEGNLGKADAYHALGMDKKAYLAGFQTTKIYPGQKDVTGFIQKLNASTSPMVNSKWSYSRSNDGSSNMSWMASGSLSPTPNSRFSISLQKKNYLSTSQEDPSRSQLVKGTFSQQVNSRIKLNGSLGLFQTATGERRKQHYLMKDVWANIWVNEHHKSTIGFYQEVQDFNQALVLQSLQTQHLALKNAAFWKSTGFGWYSEYYYSFYSDNNRRSLFFTSLYKNFSKASFLKTGINYINLSFQEQYPTFYYSPDMYNQLEVFGGVELKSKQENAIHFLGDAGIGMQRTNNSNQLTWRIKASLSKKINRWNFKTFGEYSSIAAVGGTGFSYQNLGLEISFQVTKQPVFFKKLKSDYSK